MRKTKTKTRGKSSMSATRRPAKKAGASTRKRKTPLHKAAAKKKSGKATRPSSRRSLKAKPKNLTTRSSMERLGRDSAVSPAAENFNPEQSQNAQEQQETRGDVKVKAGLVGRHQSGTQGSRSW
jgi:hypothetical protein